MIGLPVAVCLSLAVTTSGLETIEVVASRDGTLIEDAEGDRASGSGPTLFVGRTSEATGSIRRTALFFDVEEVLPPGAILERVALVVTVLPSNPDPRPLQVHRLRRSWGEGASSFPGGMGAAAEPGDVTWVHTFFDSETWPHPGGTFARKPSARMEVEGAGTYRVSNRFLLRDVRRWMARPGQNHGWILRGDESTGQTAKSLASRENTDSSAQPRLELTYRRK